MAASDRTIIDFGPFPGASDASVFIADAGVVAGSNVEAWIEPEATTAGWGADGVSFNGIRQLARGANLTGITSSKQGIFSCWFRQLNNQFLLNDSIFTAFQTTATALIASGASGQDVNLTAPAVSPPDSWHHFLASWDVGLNIGSAYLDDLLVDNVISRTADEVIQYASAVDWIVGASGLTGILAEMYFAPGQYLNMDTLVGGVPTNRRKFNQFVGGVLLPVSLGTDGSLPTGTAPRLYLHLDNNESPANFSTNRGTGGNFTWNGGAPIIGFPIAMTPGHSADEHKVEQIKASADRSSIVAGSGFTAYAYSTNQLNEPRGLGPRLCGRWTVGWARS